MTPYIFPLLPKRSQNHVALGIKENRLEHSDVIDFVCQVLKLDKIKLISSTKRREYAEGRFIAIGIMREEQTCLTLKAMGKLFGGRDHSTIIYANETYNDLYGTNKEFTEKVNAVKLFMYKEN